MPHADVGLPWRIEVSTTWQDHDLINSIPGTKHDKQDNVWWLPVSWANAKILSATFGDRLTIGPGLAGWGWEERSGRIEPAMAARAAALTVSDEPVPEGSVLRSYQRSGVAFLQAAGSAGLFDEMGTGKTLQTIATLERTEADLGGAGAAYPALIICPNGLKRTWADEFEKWAPHRTVQIIGGGAVTRRKQLDNLHDYDVTIINYDVVRMHSRLASYGSVRLTEDEKAPGPLNRTWGAVVLDEAHKIKDPHSKQTRACWAIGDKACHRYALTGTPIANNPADLWSILHFLDADEWPGKTQFIDRYCIKSWNSFGGLDIIGIRPEVQAEFDAVVFPRYVRRLKEQVLTQLPPKVYETRYVEMSPKQAKVYKSLEAGTADLDTGLLLALDPLTKYLRLSQAASAYMEMEEVEQEDGTFKQTVSALVDPSTKLDALEDLLEETGDDPVVVFAQSRKLIELASSRLTKRKIEHGLITGAVAADVRDRAKAAFQDGRLKVLLLTLGAGAEGLTLTRASTLAFLQRGRYLANLQAEDRVHRIGAEVHDSITIVDFITVGTVEERRHEALKAKGQMIDEILHDNEIMEQIT